MASTWNAFCTFVYSRARAPTKTQREEKKYGRHCLKKKVPQGSFAYSRIRAEPNKNTALWCLYVVCTTHSSIFVVPSFNWPSTPQFGQPSKFAPAGRAPRAQWKKKRIREQGVKNLVRQSVSPSVCNAPKENKLGVNK